MRAAWRPPPRNSSSRPKSHHRTLLVAHLQGVSKPLLRYLPSAAESTSPAWKALVAENCAHHSLIPDVARAPHRERLLACPSARSLSAATRSWRGRARPQDVRASRRDARVVGRCLVPRLAARRYLARQAGRPPAAETRSENDSVPARTR